MVRERATLAAWRSRVRAPYAPLEKYRICGTFLILVNQVNQLVNQLILEKMHQYYSIAQFFCLHSYDYNDNLPLMF